MNNGTLEKFLPLSGYFYPTTVALLADRDILGLNQLCLALDRDIAYRLFSNTQLAWQYIFTQHTTNQLNHENLLLNMTHNLKRLSNSLFCWERFKEVSVLILDLSYLTFNHLIFIEDLYERLPKFPPKIIALNADLSAQDFTAELLGMQKIQRLFFKHDKHLIKKLHQAIEELQQEYFVEISSTLLNRISHTNMPYLKDPVFIKRFRHICRLAKVTEYYFYEKAKGFLLVHADGKLSFLAVRLDQAEATNTIEWQGHRYAAKLIKGDQPYWYSMIKMQESLEESLKQKIFTYREYMRKIWPPS